MLYFQKTGVAHATLAPPAPSAPKDRNFVSLDVMGATAPVNFENMYFVKRLSITKVDKQGPIKVLMCRAGTF